MYSADGAPRPPQKKKLRQFGAFQRQLNTVGHRTDGIFQKHLFRGCAKLIWEAGHRGKKAQSFHGVFTVPLFTHALSCLARRSPLGTAILENAL
jgi:hypothetical protein